MQDLLAGTVSGCLGIVTGHPLDTIKVRLQARGHLYSGPLKCILHTYRSEGMRGFFKGLVAPLVGNAPINALLFAGYEHGIRELKKHDKERYTHGDPRPPIEHVVAAGSYAGLLQCIAMSPTELVKCQMQTNTRIHNVEGPGQVLYRIIKNHGWRNGFFRGFWATVLRDVPSCGIYFGVYEAAKRKLNTIVTVSGTAPTLLTSIVAGGLAGVALWGSIYPLDVLKSKIQSMPLDTPLSERSLIPACKKAYREGGIRFFTRGFGVTLLRALPCNAVTLTSYEVCINFLRSSTVDEERGGGIMMAPHQHQHHRGEVIYPIY